jgi:hypothetical protein
VEEEQIRSQTPRFFVFWLEYKNFRERRADPIKALDCFFCLWFGTKISVRKKIRIRFTSTVSSSSGF